MTSSEICDHFKQDQIDTAQKRCSLAKEWAKRVKKCPILKRDAYRFKGFKSKQDYIFSCLHVGRDPQRGILYYTIAEVFDGRNTSYYQNLQSGTVSIYSTHFFDRYRERTNQPNLTLPQAIADYTYNATMLCCIYYDYEKGRVVYAVANGICLCTTDFDENNKKFYFRTFVSYDMLKDTQEGAWKVMKEEMERYQDTIGHIKNTGSPYYQKMLQELNDKDGTLRTEEANKIYAQFFET